MIRLVESNTNRPERCNSKLTRVYRGQQRERFGIEGGAVGDYCASCWCACCVLVQSDKESIVRTTGMDPKTKVAYQPVGGMTYSA